MTAQQALTAALAEALALDGWTRYHRNPAMAQAGAVEAMRTVGPVLDQLLWEHGQQVLRGAAEEVREQHGTASLAAKRIDARAGAHGDGEQDAVGRCGEESPRIAGGTPSFCQLRAGHPGWHRADDGTEWNRLGTQPVDGEQRHDALRAALRIHHPIMRSETGPFSGCRCGQVRLGEDVIAHVLEHLSAAMDGPAAGYTPTCQARHEYDSDGLRITVYCELTPGHGGQHTDHGVEWA